jgi:hypothetical protein
VTAYPPVEESAAALVREGWAPSVATTPSANRPAWAVRASRGGRAVEGRGVTEAEAWYAACREAFKTGRR